MSATTVSPATRRPVTLYVLGLLALAAAGLAVWWYGPWNEDHRYQSMSLLALRQTADANPNNKKAWHRLAVRLADTGNADLAEPVLRKAYELDPSDPEVGTGLGELLMSTGRVPEAFQVLTGTVQNHPVFPLARMALGRLYRRKGSYLHAAEQFQAAIAADKKISDAWYELAICNLQMQKGADARNAIAEAIRLAPNEAHYLALKSSIDAVVGATDEGIATAKRAAELDPKSPKVQINYINILLAHYRGSDDLNEAEKTIKHLEEIDPKLRILPFQKGELERRRQNWAAAEQLLVQAIQAAPDLDEAYFSLSQVCRRLGKTKEADKIEKYYRRRQYLRQEINAVGLTLGANPKDVKSYIRLSDLNLEAGDRQAAESALRNVLMIDPTSTEARQKLQKLSGTSTTPQEGAAPPPASQETTSGGSAVP